MMTKEDILDYLTRHKKVLHDKYQISKVGLFGSFARDENKKDSDIDIAIETKVSDYFLLFDLKEELEHDLHKNVDLVRLRDNMNPALKRRIEKDALYV